MYDEIDGPLSGLLDSGGEMLALLTLGEARVMRYDLWLFGQGDGPGSESARELSDRMDRRLRLKYPDDDMTIAGVGQQHGFL